MSVQASIDIKFSSSNENNTTTFNIINLLLKGGWTLNDTGGISYLPLGDDGDFDWILSAKISPEELMKTIQEKQEEKELIGVVLTWQNTNIGGSFLFYPSNEISMSLNVDRQVLYGINNFKTTDANWYLSRLIPIFYENNIALKSFTFDELR